MTSTSWMFIVRGGNEEITSERHPSAKISLLSNLSGYRVFCGLSLRSSSVLLVYVQSLGALTAGLVFLESASAGEWGWYVGRVRRCLLFPLSDHSPLLPCTKPRHSPSTPFFCSVLLSRKCSAMFLGSITTLKYSFRCRSVGIRISFLYF